MFVLIPERRVQKYAAQEKEDIEPQITELLELAEKSLDNWEKKEALIRAKARLLVIGFASACCSTWLHRLKQHRDATWNYHRLTEMTLARSKCCRRSVSDWSKSCLR